MEEESKCKEFTNPIDYVILFLLMFGTTVMWQLLHAFVNKMYPYLDKTRRMRIHDYYIETMARFTMLVVMAITGWRRLTYQFFGRVNDVQCWEFEFGCYVLTVIGIIAVYQMFFGIWTTKDAFVHHLILIYTIIDFVTNPQISDIYIGYNAILITAFGLVMFIKPVSIRYQIAMHYYKETGDVQYVRTARDAVQQRRLMLIANLIFSWTLCLGWYFIQALFVEGLFKDSKFMLSRFLPFVLFYLVEVYMIRINTKILRKKEAQVTVAVSEITKEEVKQVAVAMNDIIVDELILRMPTGHLI